MAAGATATHDINIVDLGAVPDDGKDDSPALQKAIELCQARPGSRLVFPKGQYDLMGKGPFTFTQCRDLQIAGNGSLLLFEDLSQGIFFQTCQNVTVEDLIVDNRKPGFFAGTLTAVSAENRTADIQVLPNYPLDGNMTIGAWMEYEPNSSIPSSSGMEAYSTPPSKAELIGPQLLRMHLPDVSWMRPGTFLVVRQTVYGQCAFATIVGANYQFRNITVYTAAGMGLVSDRCENILLHKFNVLRREDRHMSTTADATHFVMCRGTVTLEDCTFEGMGDDGTNIHSYFLPVRRIDDLTLDAGDKPHRAPLTGDTVEFVGPDIQPFATATLADVTVDPHTQRVTVKLTAPLSTPLPEGTLMLDATCLPKTTITGCTVRSNRARGFLIATRDVLIERNTFENVSSHAILVENDTNYWMEAGPTRNVTLRDNKVTHCNYGVAKGAGAIQAYAYSPGGKNPPAGVHQNLTIEGNIVTGTDGAGIAVLSSSNVKIRNNRLDDCCRRDKKTPGAIYLENVSDVEMLDNIIGPLPAGFKPVAEGPGCKNVEIK
ncbi:MAG: right-handed parallel beta-helix repeat-containing protein [Phycisphaerae bacterium]|jgi:parallel beta-helix repeat protein